MITEEFSFPIITNSSVVHLTVLPPLWKVSSVNHEQETNGSVLRRVISRSFSEVEEQIMKVERDREAEAAEEKMDMLWEDFNEELCSSNDNNSCNSGYFGRGGLCNYQRDDHILYDEANDDIDVGGLEMTPGRLIPAMKKKKKKLKLVVKMMRKLLMVQNMARIKKRATNY